MIFFASVQFHAYAEVTPWYDFYCALVGRWRHPTSDFYDIEHLSRKLKAEGLLLDQNVITKELPLYYKKITEALLNELWKTALESIAEDHGIQQLLPYFSQFVMNQISKNLCNVRTRLCFLFWTYHIFIRILLTSITERKPFDDPNEITELFVGTLILVQWV